MKTVSNPGWKILRDAELVKLKISEPRWMILRNQEIRTMVEKESMTMAAIGKVWGISKQRVHQVYWKEKLRQEGADV